MQFFHDRIIQLGIGWNERPLGERDVALLCRRFKITITELPLRVAGFYYRVMGRDHIAINSRLKGNERLAVIFHELGHFLFHAPDSGTTANFHGVGRRTRKEIEADVFALCALMPAEMIRSRRPDELVDEGFPPEMVSERMRIFRDHGL
jgi:Zn-dependent peptidase ImmA (M78 family)